MLVKMLVLVNLSREWICFVLCVFLERADEQTKSSALKQEKRQLDLVGEIQQLVERQEREHAQHQEELAGMGFFSQYFFF